MAVARVPPDGVNPDDREGSMLRRRTIGLAGLGAAALLACGPLALAAKPPPNWDNLVRVQSKKLPYVYLAPGADFRAYHKVMLDPTEIAFEKNWQRDYNRDATGGLSGRISDSEMQKTIQKGVSAANDIFAQAFTEAGYPVVTEPGPDVLRVRIGLLDLSVTAPDRKSAGRNYNFAGEAGYATLVVEVRDSQSNALMGRAVDRKVAGDLSSAWRTSVSNRADFRVLVKNWAKTSAQGLEELKARSPINAEGMQQAQK
jgi:hypothetical protein